MPISSKIHVNSIPTADTAAAPQALLQPPSPPQECDGVVKVIGQLRAPQNVVDIFSCAFNEDATKLLYGSGNGAIYLVDTKFDENETQQHSHSANAESHVAAAPLFIRRAAESRMIKKISIDNAPITCIRCAYDAKTPETFYAASSDGCLYRSVGCSEFELFVGQQPGNELHCLDISPEGDQICTAGKNASIYHYDKNGRLLHEYKSTEMMASGFEVGAGGGGVINFPTSPAASSMLAANSSHVNAVDMIARPGFLNKTAAGSVPPPLDSGRGVGHSQRIFSLKWNPRSHFVIVSGGWDNVLKIWDIRTREGVVRSIFGPHVRGADAIDFSHGQLVTASFTAHDALQLWDYGSGRLIKSIPFCDEKEKEYLYAARFYGTQCVVAGGSGQNVAKVFHLQSSDEKTRQQNDSTVSAACIGTIPVSKMLNTIDVVNARFVIPAQPDRILVCSLDSAAPVSDEQSSSHHKLGLLWDVRRETMHENDKLKNFEKAAAAANPQQQQQNEQQEKQESAQRMRRSHRFSHDHSSQDASLGQRPSVKNLFDKWEAK